jgi:hypothetical protein
MALLNPSIFESMKRYFSIFQVLAWLGAVVVFGAEERVKLAAAKPQNGVFFTYTGYMTTVLELKDGRFRYWFETDVKRATEPNYPLMGEYTVHEGVLTLKHPQVSQPQWTFRVVNGLLTLWRPDAMEFSPDTRFDLQQLKNYGAGSILTFTEKPAEDVWLHRGPPIR